jgi:hypothetical protein
MNSRPFFNGQTHTSNREQVQCWLYLTGQSFETLVPYGAPSQVKQVVGDRFQPWSGVCELVNSLPPMASDDSEATNFRRWLGVVRPSLDSMFETNEINERDQRSAKVIARLPSTQLSRRPFQTAIQDWLNSYVKQIDQPIGLWIPHAQAMDWESLSLFEWLQSQPKLARWFPMVIGVQHFSNQPTAIETQYRQVLDEIQGYSSTLTIPTNDSGYQPTRECLSVGHRQELLSDECLPRAAQAFASEAFSVVISLSIEEEKLFRASPEHSLLVGLSYHAWSPHDPVWARLMNDWLYPIRTQLVEPTDRAHVLYRLSVFQTKVEGLSAQGLEFAQQGLEQIELANPLSARTLLTKAWLFDALACAAWDQQDEHGALQAWEQASTVLKLPEHCILDVPSYLFEETRDHLRFHRGRAQTTLRHQNPSRLLKTLSVASKRGRENMVDWRFWCAQFARMAHPNNHLFYFSRFVEMLAT